MSIYLMWSMLVMAWVSRFIAVRFGSVSPPMQKFHGLRVISDPVPLILLLSIGFGGMIAGMASINYGGVLLVITLISLSVSREPSFSLRTYCISIAIFVSLASVVAVPGLTIIFVSAIIPFVGASVIKGCEWLGAKIEW
jgi:hypothetical protein